VIPPVPVTGKRRGTFSIIFQKENPEIKNVKNFFRLYENGEPIGKTHKTRFEIQQCRAEKSREMATFFYKNIKIYFMTR